MTNKNMFSWLIIFLLSIPLFVGGYWCFWPIDILDVKSVQFDTDKHTFHPGETVAYHLTYDKYKSVTADLSKVMIKQDEPNKGLIVTIIATSRPGSLPIGMNQHSVAYFIVPMTAPTGRYKLIATARYRANPLRDFYETWESPCFEVVAK